MAEFGEALSERELDVLRCAVRGVANKEIAAELFISQNTVKVHLRNIFTKMGVSSRAEMVTVALQRRLVTLPGGETAVSPTIEEPMDVVLATNGEIAQRPFAPDLPVETAISVPETAESGAPPQRRWLVATLLLLALVGVFLVGYWAAQAFTDQPTPTPTPVQEQALDEDNRWVSTQPMPEARAGMAVATVGLNVYYIGGETAEGVVGDGYLYHTSEKTWQPLVEKPTAVTQASAVVLFGEIYVVGGRLADGRPSDAVEAYSPTNNAWRRVGSLPHPIAGGLALTDAGFLYLFGGWDGEQYLNSAYVYDVESNAWELLPPMSQARAFSAGGLLTGSFYVVGGYDGVEELRTCEFYDPNARAWETCPEMTSPRAGMGSAVLLNKLYVIGGGWEGKNEITFSESYDPISRTWRIVNTPTLAEIPNWTDVAVIPVETRIFVTGGRRNGQLTADNFAFTVIYQTYLPAFTKEN